MKKLGKPRKQVDVVEAVDLAADGLFNSELGAILHEAPSHIHRERAAEAMGLLDVGELPVFGTVAEMLAYILTVKATLDDKSMNAVLDRISPKAARESANVNVSVGEAPPAVASENAEEAKAAQDYIKLLGTK